MTKRKRFPLSDKFDAISDVMKQTNAAEKYGVPTNTMYYMVFHLLSRLAENLEIWELDKMKTDWALCGRKHQNEQSSRQRDNFYKIRLNTPRNYILLIFFQHIERFSFEKCILTRKKQEKIDDYLKCLIGSHIHVNLSEFISSFSEPQLYRTTFRGHYIWFSTVCMVNVKYSRYP